MDIQKAYEEAAYQAAIQIAKEILTERRCENCKHWDTGDEEPGELFLCNELLREAGKWNAKINIGGYDDYGLSVHTAKDFGCTLFERKGGENG